ncbi:hypothetical protein DFJ58DRAFT_817505 [Suillus subalutaceus]|uniref:uncharacterized protein n=1 Tax=Suillus subalutaceus TaxID=48586 RepID=UPI001B87CD8E|nr:uncharacterized protein DFJ58DRAFT_817505 [Suillus subalutaceus]KAG1836825.1 hypothetical protein DFJ58DRAFT_817505 [Suillus subalutaceus]
MTFGEVVHYVTQPTDWPEPVRGIASLLSPFHCPDRPNASSSTFSEPEPLVSNEAPAPGSYTAKGFSAAGLSALAELPHYGGERSTVPLLTLDSCDGSIDSLDLPLQAHMLPGRGRRLSAVVPVLLVADSRNIVPLLCSALYQRHVWGIRQPVVGLCCSSTGTIATAIFGWLDSDQSEEGRMASPKSMHSHLALAVDVRLDPSMGVFDFTDTRSAISLAQFVLGLRTHSQDIKGRHIDRSSRFSDSVALEIRLPDFETQFWGRSNERVASWTHQIHVQTSYRDHPHLSPRTPSPTLDTAVVSYETMSSPLLRTIPMSRLVNTQLTRSFRLPQETRATNVKGRHLIKEDQCHRHSRTWRIRTSTSSRAPSPYPNSQFAALSDTGLKDKVSISNWLFERHAFTVARIPVRSEELANKTGINAMIKIYDQMTAFTWSDNIKTILSNAEVDSFVSTTRSELCDRNSDPNCQSSTIDAPSPEDVKFISCRISALLHAVKGARRCDDVAKLHGANEADRRHEWDALLLNFFQPVLGQRDVLLERQLNFARNLRCRDSFPSRHEPSRSLSNTRTSVLEQHRCVRLTAETSGSWAQTAAARDQAFQFSDDIDRRDMNRNAAEVIACHSSQDPLTGQCDASSSFHVPGFATVMLQHISNIGEQEKLLEYFMLVQGPKPEKLDASTEEASYQIEKTVGHSQKTTPSQSLQVPSSSRVSESRKIDRKQLHNPFLYHPDGHQATQKEENNTFQSVVGRVQEEGRVHNFDGHEQMKSYLVSAVTFLSKFGIIDQPVFGLVVNGALGAITMAWKRNNQIYVMERNVRHYDIRDPLQALQFVSILPRLARHGLELRRLLEKQLATIDVSQLQSKPWSKLAQRQEDKRLAAAKRAESEKAVAEDHR